MSRKAFDWYALSRLNPSSPDLKKFYELLKYSQVTGSMFEAALPYKVQLLQAFQQSHFLLQAQARSQQADLKAKENMRNSIAHNIALLQTELEASCKRITAAQSALADKKKKRLARKSKRKVIEKYFCPFCHKDDFPSKEIFTSHMYTLHHTPQPMASSRELKEFLNAVKEKEIQFMESMMKQTQELQSMRFHELKQQARPDLTYQAYLDEHKNQGSVGHDQGYTSHEYTSHEYTSQGYTSHEYTSQGHTEEPMTGRSDEEELRASTEFVYLQPGLQAKRALEHEQKKQEVVKRQRIGQHKEYKSETNLPSPREEYYRGSEKRETLPVKKNPQRNEYYHAYPEHDKPVVERPIIESIDVRESVPEEKCNEIEYSRVERVNRITDSSKPSFMINQTKFKENSVMFDYKERPYEIKETQILANKEPYGKMKETQSQQQANKELLKMKETQPQNRDLYTSMSYGTNANYGGNAASWDNQMNSTKFNHPVEKRSIVPFMRQLSQEKSILGHSRDNFSSLREISSPTRLASSNSQCLYTNALPEHSLIREEQIKITTPLREAHPSSHHLQLSSNRSDLINPSFFQRSQEKTSYEASDSMNKDLTLSRSINTSELFQRRLIKNKEEELQFRPTPKHQEKVVQYKWIKQFQRNPNILSSTVQPSP